MNFVGEFEYINAADQAWLDFEIEQEQKIVPAFEKQVAELIGVGARDRETALRWIVDGLELSENEKRYGAGYVCYRLGLPYSMESEFDFVKES